MKQYIMTVDPGASGTGLTFWDERKWVSNSAVPELWGNVYPPSIEKFEARVYEMLHRIERDFPVDRVVAIYCEQPDYRVSAFGEKVAKSGDLFKLMFMTGAMMTFSYLADCEFNLVSYREWKGNLTKKMVVSRISRILEPEISGEFRDHIWDAVGLGLYLQGRF